MSKKMSLLFAVVSVLLMIATAVSISYSGWIAVLFLLLHGRMGFVRWLRAGDLPIPIAAPIVAAILAVATGMRRRRFGANIILAFVAPIFVLALMGAAFESNQALFLGVFVAVVAVCLAAVSVFRRGRGFIELGAMALVLFLLFRVDVFSYLTRPVLLASWGFLLLKGARYCGPGALKRTVWVLLLLALVATAMRFGSTTATVIRYRNVDPSLLAVFLVVGAVVSGAMSLLFLRITARQLDGLMGRNG